MKSSRSPLELRVPSRRGRSQEVSRETLIQFRVIAHFGRFIAMKSQTEFPFAKAAEIRGGNPGVVDSQTSLEGQAKANLAALEEFTTRSNHGEKLDGY
jgi:hypothetical protein